MAVGPVHAGIIEPGHFRFQGHGEEVLFLEITLGYQHRGVERLLETRDAARGVLVAESIAGDTVIGHAGAYCGALEALARSRKTPRAQAIAASPSSSSGWPITSATWARSPATWPTCRPRPTSAACGASVSTC